MKIVSIVGTRPQIIKMSTIWKRRRHIVIHTGQHYDETLSGVFFENLGVSLDVCLDVGSGSHGYQIGKGMMLIEEELELISPDIVLVYGDSNSVTSASIVANRMGIPVGHVEAGCRSGELYLPEETNRIIADHLSRYLFSISPGTTANLLHEGISEDRIYEVGSVLVDLCDRYVRKISDDDYYLMTIHRPMNSSRDVIRHLLHQASKLDKPVIFPAHPRIHPDRIPDNVEITPPVGYVKFINLLATCSCIITDSGGAQQEAAILGKRVVRVRNRGAVPELDTYNGMISSYDIVSAVKALRSITPVRLNLGSGVIADKILEVIVG